MSDAPPAPSSRARDVRALPGGPLRLAGAVVKGFGRGSRELGVPTANLDAAALGPALVAAPAGVYAGWARVVGVDDGVPTVGAVGAVGGGGAAPGGGDGGGSDGGGGAGPPRGVHKMVMSIGWNPFYGNATKTVEPHLLAAFPADFYGRELRLIAAAYIRPESNFPSLGALIEAIHDDMAAGAAALDADGLRELAHDAFLADAGGGGGGVGAAAPDAATAAAGGTA